MHEIFKINIYILVNYLAAPSVFVYECVTIDFLSASCISLEIFNLICDITRCC